ncbi:hypothetical protein BD779DRAFT_1550927 [Infundibulicybe gibba]|nr:hypothetical protein BD779DRAFT_1550927 [Infundibulicybe gibba]
MACYVRCDDQSASVSNCSIEDLRCKCTSALYSQSMQSCFLAQLCDNAEVQTCSKCSISTVPLSLGTPNVVGNISDPLPSTTTAPMPGGTIFTSTNISSISSSSPGVNAPSNGTSSEQEPEPGIAHKKKINLGGILGITIAAIVLAFVFKFARIRMHFDSDPRKYIPPRRARLRPYRPPPPRRPRAPLERRKRRRRKNRWRSLIPLGREKWNRDLRFPAAWDIASKRSNCGPAIASNAQIRFLDPLPPIKKPR